VKKLTDDAECPPHIWHAHEINDLMNNKAGSCDLNDEDIVDDALELSDDEDSKKLLAQRLALALTKEAVKTEKPGRPIACCLPMDHLPTTASHSRQRNMSQDLLANLSDVSDL